MRRAVVSKCGETLSRCEASTLIASAVVNAGVKWVVPSRSMGYGYFYPPGMNYYHGQNPALYYNQQMMTQPPKGAGGRYPGGYPYGNGHTSMDEDYPFDEDKLEAEVTQLKPEQLQAAEYVQYVYNQVSGKLMEAGSSMTKPIFLSDLATIQEWQNHQSIIGVGKAASKLALTICKTYSGITDENYQRLSQLFIQTLQKTLSPKDVALAREISRLSGQGGNDLAELVTWLETHQIIKPSTSTVRGRRSSDEYDSDFSVNSLNSFAGIAVDIEQLITHIAEQNETLQDKKYSKTEGPDAVFSQLIAPVQQFRQDVAQIKLYAQTITKMTPAEKKLLPPDVENMAKQLLQPPSSIAGGLFGSKPTGAAGIFGGSSTASIFGANSLRRAGQQQSPSEDTLFLACALASNLPVIKDLSSPLIKKVVSERKHEENEQGKALLSLAWAKLVCKVMKQLSTSQNLDPELKKYNNAIIALYKETLSVPLAKLVDKDLVAK